MENATASIGSLKAPLCIFLSGNYIGFNTILKAERMNLGSLFQRVSYSLKARERKISLFFWSFWKRKQFLGNFFIRGNESAVCFKTFWRKLFRRGGREMQVSDPQWDRWHLTVLGNSNLSSFREVRDFIWRTFILNSLFSLCYLESVLSKGIVSRLCLYIWEFKLHEIYVLDI